MIRLFVALPLPHDIRLRLATLASGIPGARWVPPENFHLTLRFIGEVPQSTAADIHDMLMGIRAPGFDLWLNGVDHFGPLRKARNLWVGAQRDAALQHIHDKIESAVVRAGLPRETRKFVPHVTLARIRGETGHHLANFLAANSLFRAGPIEIDRFVLYASHMGREGSVYEELAEYYLSLPAVAVA